MKFSRVPLEHIRLSEDRPSRAIEFNPNVPVPDCMIPFYSWEKARRVDKFSDELTQAHLATLSKYRCIDPEQVLRETWSLPNDALTFEFSKYLLPAMFRRPNQNADEPSKLYMCKACKFPIKKAHKQTKCGPEDPEFEHCYDHFVKLHKVDWIDVKHLTKLNHFPAYRWFIESPEIKEGFHLRGYIEQKTDGKRFITLGNYISKVLEDPNAPQREPRFPEIMDMINIYGKPLVDHLSDPTWLDTKLQQFDDIVTQIYALETFTCHKLSVTCGLYIMALAPLGYGLMDSLNVLNYGGRCLFQEDLTSRENSHCGHAFAYANDTSKIPPTKCDEFAGNCLREGLAIMNIFLNKKFYNELAIGFAEMVLIAFVSLSPMCTNSKLEISIRNLDLLDELGLDYTELQQFGAALVISALNQVNESTRVWFIQDKFEKLERKFIPRYHI